MSKGIGIKNNYKLGGSINKATNVQKANVGLLIKAFGKLPVVKQQVHRALYRMTNPLQRGVTLRAGDAGKSSVKDIANPSKFMERRMKLSAGDVGKSSVKDTAKKILTSKTNIAGTAGTAGYEIGKADNEEKTEGKKYGGSMKKMASGGMSKKENKIKKVMGEYKKGELNIGKSKKKVKSKKQAIAIALASAKKKKA